MSDGNHAEPNLPTGLSRPAQRALASAGVRRLEDLTDFSEAQLLELHGVGPTAIPFVVSALAERGLLLRDAR